MLLSPARSASPPSVLQWHRCDGQLELRPEDRQRWEELPRQFREAWESNVRFDVKRFLSGRLSKSDSTCCPKDGGRIPVLHKGDGATGPWRFTWCSYCRMGFLFIKDDFYGWEHCADVFWDAGQKKYRRRWRLETSGRRLDRPGQGNHRRGRSLHRDLVPAQQQQRRRHLSFTPFGYGAPGWSVVAGAWNGIQSGIGVFNPATATWYLRNEVGPGGADAGIFQYGGGNWKPVVGDWSYSGLPQLAAGGEATVPSGAAPLTEDQLQSEVQAALNLLASDGVNKALLAQLGSLQFSVGLLPAGYLGLSDVPAGTVEISANAAGYGWFVDANPLHDQPPANRMDLLTVVLHEMGHFDGWTELDPATNPDALMALTLGTGQRRIQDIDAVFAAR